MDSLQAARVGLQALDTDPTVVEAALTSLEPWLGDDVFLDYRPQIESLIRRGRFELLLDAFWQTIPFGTGGRRGPVGVGPNRFNPFTLGTSVQGHAEILKETYPDEDVAVVVAYDVRVYRDLRGHYDPEAPNPLVGMSSADFAAVAAGVYVANGVRVHMLDPRGDTYMSTPELSYAIRRLGAHGGLNVSASHNHPDDNGGKVYNRYGGQDVPPDDEILARRVEGITRVKRVPFEEALASGRIALLGPEENRAYLELNKSLAVCPGERGGRIVYSPLHGTGSCTVGRLLEAEGFDVRGVPSQQAFDGGFPAVKFLAPNPEVPACYEAAEVVADSCDADIILTTDPDADRIGMEARRPDGGWEFVTGNELLFLITRFHLDQRREQGRLPADAFLLTTIVTSSLVSTIAQSYGCRVVNHLMVGFKYMGEILAALEKSGQWEDLHAPPESFLLGAEESHGVLLTPEIRDKDAAGAALALAELNASLRARGRTMLEELDAIYCRFGYVANRLVNTVMTGSAGLQRIRAIQDSLRSDPPGEIGGCAVIEFEDMGDPEGRLGPLKSGTDAAGRNVLQFRLEDNSRVVIRPSGTEPKNKLYIEVPGRTPPAEDLASEELAAERERCDRRAVELGRAFEVLMLSRVGIELPATGAAVSGLVSLDNKLHFANEFLPALAARLDGGDDGLEAFLDESLGGYGKDPRDLVAPGVEAWLQAGGVPQQAAARARELFGLAG